MKTFPIRVVIPSMCLFLFHTMARVRADVIPEGYKTIDFTMFFEGMDKFPEYSFILYPTHFHNGDFDVAACREVKLGENVRFYHLVSPELFAIPKGAALKAELFNEGAPTPRSTARIYRTSVVSEGDDAKSLKRTYQITGIEGKVVKLERFDSLNGSSPKLMDEQESLIREYPPGNRLSRYVLGAAAGLFIALVWFFKKRRMARKEVN